MGVCVRSEASRTLGRATTAMSCFGSTAPHRPTVAKRSTMLAWSVSAGSVHAIGVSARTTASAVIAAIGASC